MDNDMDANLVHQLLERELESRSQRTPNAFTANLFKQRYRLAKNLYKTDLRAHYGCVNAIEFSNGGQFLASGGDDKRVLIWDIEKAIATQSRPHTLNTEHTSNIFCLGFDRHNNKVFSGGNDDLVIVHDFETGKLANVFKHDNPVYGLSIDPHCDSIFATACEDGQILVFDQRVDPADPFVVAQLRTSFHAVEFHPAGGNFLVTANSKRGAAFWDIRKPHHPVIQYGYVEDPPSCMSVRFNSTGSLILALRRRLPPILYNTQSAEPVCTFYHDNYYNSCTMKSCTFAGEDDEFVLSGSDDFNLYVWRVSDVDLGRTDQWIETTQMVLYGHRSIVNQVRYNRQKCLLASSGVEKIIKLWSPFAQKGWTGSLLKEATWSDNPRELYSPYSFNSMSTPPHSWSHMSHDYSSRNTNEDPRMMAFFDSLIQQEIEGWESSTSTDSPAGSEGSRSPHSSSNQSTDSSLDDDDDDDDGDAGTAERVDRRPKRNLVRRQDRKHRRSVLSKAKVQRHKYANRIAYLIATKRNSLRRLAIKGASVSNRRPYKIVKVGRNTKTTDNKSKRSHRVTTRSKSRSSVVCTSSVAIASTSAAAAASSTVNSFRAQRKKHKKNRVYDTSSDDTADSGNLNASSSNRYNGLTNPSNVPVPSTSTGITSSLKGDIMRLRRQQQQQIIDSDEDDDDELPVSTTSGLSTAEIIVDPTVQPTKKLNGVRRVNDATVMERHSIGTPSVNTLSAIEPSSLTATMLPQTNHNNRNTANRRRPHADLLDNYSSHSNSRLSNSSYQDDVLDSSASSSSSAPPLVSNSYQQQQQLNQVRTTVLKRRRLDISEYINRRSEIQDNGIEENNNEENNNNNSICPSSCRTTESTTTTICSNNNNNMTEYPIQPNCSMQTTPLKRDARPSLPHVGRHQQQNHEQLCDNIASTSSASQLLYTPDSGISVATITPSRTGCTSDESQHIGNNNDATPRQLPCVDSPNTALNLFQQKIARVRRNYRKKFDDESDSD